jgi:acetolactate synthase-1/2/3 large subunit
VRDVTVSNSTWGNRSLRIAGPRDGVHALGGGIGQGVQMAIGAALAAGNRKTLCLVGDGGLQVNIGELATLVQEKANVLVLLMNDRGYGVIRNIQDAQYGGRRYYADLHTPTSSVSRCRSRCRFIACATLDRWARRSATRSPSPVQQ